MSTATTSATAASTFFSSLYRYGFSPSRMTPNGLEAVTLASALTAARAALEESPTAALNVLKEGNDTTVSAVTDVMFSSQPSSYINHYAPVPVPDPTVDATSPMSPPEGSNSPSASSPPEKHPERGQVDDPRLVLSQSFVLASGGKIDLDTDPAHCGKLFNVVPQDRVDNAIVLGVGYWPPLKKDSSQNKNQSGVAVEEPKQQIVLFAGLEDCPNIAVPYDGSTTLKVRPFPGGTVHPHLVCRATIPGIPPAPSSSSSTSDGAVGGGGPALIVACGDQAIFSLTVAADSNRDKNLWESAVNAEYLQRAETIPVEPFLHHLTQQRGTIIFTGMGHGSAVAELLAAKILFQMRSGGLAAEALSQCRILFIGFCPPLVGSQKYGFQLTQTSGGSDVFHFFQTHSDVLSRVPNLSTLIQEKMASNHQPGLKVLFKKVVHESAPAGIPRAVAEMVKEQFPRWCEVGCRYASLRVVKSYGTWYSSDCNDERIEKIIKIHPPRSHELNVTATQQDMFLLDAEALASLSSFPAERFAHGCTPQPVAVRSMLNKLIDRHTADVLATSTSSENESGQHLAAGNIEGGEVRRTMLFPPVTPSTISFEQTFYNQDKRELRLTFCTESEQQGEKGGSDESRDYVFPFSFTLSPKVDISFGSMTLSCTLPSFKGVAAPPYPRTVVLRPTAAQATAIQQTIHQYTPNQPDGATKVRFNSIYTTSCRTAGGALHQQQQQEEEELEWVEKPLRVKMRILDSDVVTLVRRGHFLALCSYAAKATQERNTVAHQAATELKRLDDVVCQRNLVDVRLEETETELNVTADDELILQSGSNMDKCWFGVGGRGEKTALNRKALGFRLVPAGPPGKPKQYFNIQSITSGCWWGSSEGYWVKECVDRAEACKVSVETLSDPGCFTLKLVDAPDASTTGDSGSTSPQWRLVLCWSWRAYWFGWRPRGQADISENVGKVKIFKIGSREEVPLKRTAVTIKQMRSDPLLLCSRLLVHQYIARGGDHLDEVRQQMLSDPKGYLDGLAKFLPTQHDAVVQAKESFAVHSTTVEQLLKFPTVTGPSTHPEMITVGKFVKTHDCGLPPSCPLHDVFEAWNGKKTHDMGFTTAFFAGLPSLMYATLCACYVGSKIQFHEAKEVVDKRSRWRRFFSFKKITKPDETVLISDSYHGRLVQLLLRLCSNHPVIVALQQQAEQATDEIDDDKFRSQWELPRLHEMLLSYDEWKKADDAIPMQYETLHADDFSEDKIASLQTLFREKPSIELTKCLVFLYRVMMQIARVDLLVKRSELVVVFGPQQVGKSLAMTTLTRAETHRDGDGHTKEPCIAASNTTKDKFTLLLDNPGITDPGSEIQALQSLTLGVAKGVIVFHTMTTDQHNLHEDPEYFSPFRGLRAGTPIVVLLVKSNMLFTKLLRDCKAGGLPSQLRFVPEASNNTMVTPTAYRIQFSWNNSLYESDDTVSHGTQYQKTKADLMSGGGGPTAAAVTLKWTSEDQTTLTISRGSMNISLHRTASPTTTTEVSVDVVDVKVVENSITDSAPASSAKAVEMLRTTLPDLYDTVSSANPDFDYPDDFESHLRQALEQQGLQLTDAILELLDAEDNFYIFLAKLAAHLHATGEDMDSPRRSSAGPAAITTTDTEWFRTRVLSLVLDNAAQLRSSIVSKINEHAQIEERSVQLFVPDTAESFYEDFSPSSSLPSPSSLVDHVKLRGGSAVCMRIVGSSATLCATTSSVQLKRVLPMELDPFFLEPSSRLSEEGVTRQREQRAKVAATIAHLTKTFTEASVRVVLDQEDLRAFLLSRCGFYANVSTAVYELMGMSTFFVPTVPKVGATRPGH